jgi:F0F1-type ATP synthase beta subunit
MSIHRQAPKLKIYQLHLKFYSGIKVIDLIEPYSKGVKLDYLVVQVLENSIDSRVD